MYKDELLGKVTTFAGGRAADARGKRTLWRERYIQRATNLVYKSIAELGFSAEGPFMPTLSTGGNDDFLRFRQIERPTPEESEGKYTLTRLSSSRATSLFQPGRHDRVDGCTRGKGKDSRRRVANVSRPRGRPAELETFLRGDAPPVTSRTSSSCRRFLYPILPRTMR